MVVETAFSDSKWRILSELAVESLSPSELAKKTGTSIANISVQLRLLEALELVQNEKLKNIGKGEPRKLYSLKKEFGYLILASKTVMGKKLFNIDDQSIFFFSVWMINDSNAPYVMIKLYTENDFLLQSALSIGYLGIRGDELELLILHDDPNSLQFLNEKTVLFKDKNYKVRAHIHKVEDFENGVKNNEEYFITILKKVFVVLDKNQTLSKLKKR